VTYVAQNLQILSCGLVALLSRPDVIPVVLCREGHIFQAGNLGEIANVSKLVAKHSGKSSCKLYQSNRKPRYLQPNLS
jgi:hypothetical protein